MELKDKQIQLLNEIAHQSQASRQTDQENSHHTQELLLKNMSTMQEQYKKIITEIWDSILHLCNAYENGLHDPRSQTGQGEPPHLSLIHDLREEASKYRYKYKHIFTPKTQRQAAGQSPMSPFMSTHRLYVLIGAQQEDDDDTLKKKAREWIMKMHPDKNSDDSHAQGEQYHSNSLLIKCVMWHQKEFINESGRKTTLLGEYKKRGDEWLDGFYRKNPKATDGDLLFKSRWLGHWDALR